MLRIMLANSVGRNVVCRVTLDELITALEGANYLYEKLGLASLYREVSRLIFHVSFITANYQLPDGVTDSY
jgi:hypothetical protein